ncbi:E3 ubiquitin-protein transferase RMND5B isoform X2 [Desmodus rotundus]|nr:E3 ubiquitin-protein transferase RMND5B isoform X2 [Desmodus rotundus]
MGAGGPGASSRWESRLASPTHPQTSRASERGRSDPSRIPHTWRVAMQPAARARATTSASRRRRTPAGDSTLGTREGRLGAQADAGRHPSAKPQVGESRPAEQPPQLPVPWTAAPEAGAGRSRQVRAAASGREVRVEGRSGQPLRRAPRPPPPKHPSPSARRLVCSAAVGPGRELEPLRLVGHSWKLPCRGNRPNSHIPSYCEPAASEAEAAMEQCTSVEREVDKVLQKFLTYGQHFEQSLEELLHCVGRLRAELARAALQGTSLSATLSLVMSQCCQKIKDAVQKLASDHKDIHSSVSRVGKAIDRNFDSEICGVVSDAVWDSQEKQQQTLQLAIVEHLYQQGMLSVAEELCQESTLNVDLDFKQPFLELNRILEALHRHDLGPALEWAVSHRQPLLELNSSLEFKLHRLHFIHLLAGGPDKQLEALNYARHFQPFARLHQRDIQVMMGSLVYLRLGLENSPYCHLLDNSHWAEICETFTRDACSLLGLSVESPLSVSFASGCVALPMLMNIKAVIEQRQCTGVWSHKDELPIEIELGMKCWFHSVFACPILRQQTSESNPPIKLICGHVISQDALNKLVNGGKLKCPYCPVEQNPADGKRIIF